MFCPAGVFNAHRRQDGAPSLWIWKPLTSRAGEQQSFIESLVMQMLFPDTSHASPLRGQGGYSRPHQWHLRLTASATLAPSSVLPFLDNEQRSTCLG